MLVGMGELASYVRKHLSPSRWSFCVSWPQHLQVQAMNTDVSSADPTISVHPVAAQLAESYHQRGKGTGRGRASEITATSNV